MKKFKILLASLVFLLIVLVCSQVNASSTVTISTPVDLGAFLNSGGGNVTIEGSKITLNHDVNVTNSIYFYTTSGEEIILDLNGYNLDFTFDSEFDPIAAIWSNYGGKLTIIDSSSNENNFIRQNRDVLISWNTSNPLTIENVNLYSAWSYTEPTFNNSETGLVNLKNVKITAYKYVLSAQQHTKYNFENVTISLGYTDYEYAIRLGAYNELTLKNCSFRSTTGAGRFLSIESSEAKAVIDGGSYVYEGTTSNNYLIYNEEGTLEIKDGTFTNKEGTVVRTVDGKTTISGGEFDGKNRTITTALDTTLTLKGGYFKARSNTSEPGAAIGFNQNKTFADLVPEGYFATDTSIRKQSGFALSGPEVNVYAKPASITFDKTELTYNGKNQAPKVIVKDTDGRVLQYDTDYVVQYPTNRKDVGEYKVKVVFIDRYETMPSKEFSYKIVKANFDMSKVKFEDKKLTYNGKKQKIKVTGLPAGVTVSYKNNKKKDIGEYKVTAIFTLADTKNYNPIPNKTAKMTIAPKGTSLNRLTAGKKQFKATWKKQTTKTSGYELQYATNKSFSSGKKKVTIKKNKTTSTTVKKLKGKKKYYVRIRTFKTVNGKKIYSEWSGSKKVTTKK